VVLNVPTQKLKRFRPTVQDSFEALLCHQVINTAGRGVERGDEQGEVEPEDLIDRGVFFLLPMNNSVAMPQLHTLYTC